MVKSEYVAPETIKGITAENGKDSYEKSAAKVDYLIKNVLNSIEIIEQYSFKDLDAEKRTYYFIASNKVVLEIISLANRYIRSHNVIEMTL